MLEMALDSMNIAEKGFDSVWDARMFSFIWKYVQDGISLIEYKTQEKGIKLRVIIEVTKENIDSIKSLKYHEIRHLNGIRGNFGIFDNRAYMVFIFHQENEQPDQTLWSNSKVLVDKQQVLFDKLWSMAIPLSVRSKEIKYDDKTGIEKTITNYDDIEREIESFILTCKKELTIFSSKKILSSILNKSNITKYIPSVLEKDAIIKILTDNVDEYLIKQIVSISNSNQTNLIQLGYTNKLGDLDEMVLISDDKYLLHIQYDQDNKLIATFSNEEHNILVQELMFEKYWNEVNSLTVFSNN